MTSKISTQYKLVPQSGFLHVYATVTSAVTTLSKLMFSAKVQSPFINKFAAIARICESLSAFLSSFNFLSLAICFNSFNLMSLCPATFNHFIKIACADARESPIKTKNTYI